MTNTTLKVLEVDDFSIVAHRLELFATTKAKLDLLDAELQRDCLALIDAVKAKKLALQRKLAWAEDSLLSIAEAHPEWFQAGKTLKLPFGAIHSHSATSHEAPDEERSIALIRAAIDKADAAGDDAEIERLSGLIRLREELNLDVAATFDRKTLAKFRILRIERDSITVKVAKVGASNTTKKKKEARDSAKAA